MRALLVFACFVPALAAAQSYSSGKIAGVRDAGLEIVAKACARPSNVKEEPVQTVKGVPATRRSFRCPDAEMSVILYEGRTVPYTLVVTGDKNAVTGEIRTGMLAKDVKRIFGTPEIDRGDRMQYNVPQDSGFDIVGFGHRGGRVTSIDWQFLIR